MRRIWNVYGRVRPASHLRPGAGGLSGCMLPPMQGEDFYTVEEGARALKLTPDRIRQMRRDGEIEGVPPQEGGASGWKIPRSPAPRTANFWASPEVAG